MDIRPRDFAESHLEVADRTPFKQAVHDAGLGPAVAFEKYTSLVKINGFKMTFDSGMVLVGRSEDLTERVNIRPGEANRPGVEINDTLKRLSGR